MNTTKCFRIDLIEGTTAELSEGDTPKTCFPVKMMPINEALSVVDNYRKALIKSGVYWDCTESHDCFIDEWFFSVCDTVELPTEQSGEHFQMKHKRGFFKHILSNKEQGND